MLLCSFPIHQPINLQDLARFDRFINKGLNSRKRDALSRNFSVVHGAHWVPCIKHRSISSDLVTVYRAIARVHVVPFYHYTSRFEVPTASIASCKQDKTKFWPWDSRPGPCLLEERFSLRGVGSASCRTGLEHGNSCPALKGISHPRDYRSSRAGLLQGCLKPSDFDLHQGKSLKPMTVKVFGSVFCSFALTYIKEDL